MDLKWLHTFVTAAKYENFRKAAEDLFISQPSVTIHIQMLEQEIGSKLFVRSGRRVELTLEGRKFARHAEKLLADYAESMADIQRIRQGFDQKLTLAISPVIGESIMPFILKRYMNLHPNIEIEVLVLESKDIAEKVLNGAVDLGISRAETRDGRLLCRLLYEDKVILVAPHDGQDSESAPPLDAEELLSSHYLITHNHPGYWDGLLRGIRAKVPSVRTMAVSQVSVTKRFVVEGLGISFLPQSLVRREMMEGRLLETPCPFLKMPVARTYAIMKYEHPLEKHFLEFLGQFRF